jgi:hypothetical protein
VPDSAILAFRKCPYISCAHGSRYDPPNPLWGSSVSDGPGYRSVSANVARHRQRPLPLFLFFFFFFSFCFASSQHAFAPHTPDLRKMCFYGCWFLFVALFKRQVSSPRAASLIPFSLPSPLTHPHSRQCYRLSAHEARDPGGTAVGEPEPVAGSLETIHQQPRGARALQGTCARACVCVCLSAFECMSCLEKAVEESL